MSSPDSFDIEVDIEGISAEIEAEAGQRRHQNPGIGQLEFEIQQAWAGIAHEAMASSNDDPLLDRMASRAALNPHVPVGSRRGLGGVKWMIRKLTYWYIRFITDQFNVFSGMLIRHLRGIETRLDRLEGTALSGVGGSALLDIPPEPSAATATRIADLVGPEPCLVLSGDPKALPGLSKAKDGSLETIALTGVVEVLPLRHLVEIIHLAGRKLTETSRIIVAVADPATRNRVESELGSGLGISPAAWRHLLERAGFEARLEPCPDPRITEIVVAERKAFRTPSKS
ncbi:hypothetical protein [Candidatus Poriferisocius sp.]|uniref:hypothetical protein n=1 Tax=Candidatus Poriferisocius sp. TaxID=3101276 RepID=UPI003B025E6D